MTKHLAFGKRIISFIKNNQQWLGFGVLVVALMYAYFHIFYEPRHIGIDILYGLFFILLLYGLYHAFRIEKAEIKIITFQNFDGLFAAVSVVVTFSLVHYFDVSSVLASSFIGVIGYLFIRKYEVPIYCGSFAGMVSVALFNFWEVGVLAVLCAFIFTLTKPLFSGYGGKLGTIAFLSSLITFSIFDKEYLSISGDFSIYVVVLVSLLGVTLTFYLQHYFHTSAVFASAMLSFLFGLVITTFFSNYIPYTFVFFAASFIGMSSKQRLPNFVFVILSGLILGLMYDIFLEYFHGLGGKLGLMAMMSVVITSGISSVYQTTHHKKQKEGSQ
jgi:hypothetical protein